MRLLKRISVTALLAMSVVCSSHATDIQIFPTGPVYRLNSLVWGTSVQPGFNNNYFFTPLNLNESVCLYVYNNNTTNAHPFTASIVITGNPNSTTPSDGTWQASASSTLTAFASPGQPGGLGAQVSGASQVSINLSGSTTLGGSPETASITIVQTPGNCFSGNSLISSAPSTVSATPPIQAVSEGLSQSFVVNTTATNPAAAQDLLVVESTATSKTIYFDRVIISSTAAATVQISGVSTAGATCTTLTPTGANLKLNNATTPTALSEITCATHPTIIPANAIQVSLIANTTTIIDLRGYIAVPGTLGIDVAPTGAVTGVITTNMLWYEK